MKKFVVGCIFILMSVTVESAELRVLSLGDPLKSNLDGWQEKVFCGNTLYQKCRVGNKEALKAHAKETASGLIKKIRVDLREYPYLNWSWRVEKGLNVADEKQKEGDDYAARVCMIIDTGLPGWRMKSMHYVWADGAEKEEVWPNAFVNEKTMMLALRTNKDQTSAWYEEKRNVFEDLKKVFGKEIRYIDAVAVMTDTDNSKGEATAYYGEMYFSKE